ncbi:hypothetical protein [Dysgonomonas sp. 520]|uniref:hypothetical protein n=1 Tax=Dysgonomonas sp. 520 TaxID=2302931 RepID=UPI0013D072E9|nr:hypothetical protein [Dysgonomonas sp. 520]NDW10933.1 hypothetical protein [Dysgonomonas sp. 520]
MDYWDFLWYLLFEHETEADNSITTKRNGQKKNTMNKNIKIMKENNKLNNLLFKLKALADQGVGGEKETAERMLKDLLKKHGLTIADVFKQDLKKFEFKVPAKHEWLFWRVVWSVIIDWDYTYWRSSRYRTHITLEIDNSQFIEIEAKFDFYVKDFESQLDLFKSAYTHKNKL